MSNHNVFSWKIKKNINNLWVKKGPYLELCYYYYARQLIKTMRKSENVNLFHFTYYQYMIMTL